MKNSLLIIGVVITLLSCKKSTSTPTGAGQTNNTTSSYTLDAHGNPSGMYSGVFNMDSSVTCDILPNFYHFYSSSSNVNCYFYTTPLSYQNFKYGITVPINSVIVNRDKFGHGFNNSYQDTANILLSPPYRWAVNGSGNIPSFTYTSAKPKPMYIGFWQIADTMNKQQNLILPLSQASGFDMCTVELYDTATYNKTITYSVSNAVSSITIPKDSLAKFTSGTGIVITAYLVKFNPQSFGGKNFLFQTILDYQKPLTVK